MSRFFVIRIRFVNNKWSAFGEFMTNQKAGNNLTGVSDEFVEYTLKAAELCHKSFLKKDNKFLHSVDIVISEKCTLNCKDCANLMQYYEDAKNIDFEMVVRDFENLVSKIDHIFEGSSKEKVIFARKLVQNITKSLFKEYIILYIVRIVT